MSSKSTPAEPERVLRALISEFEEQSESNWKTEKKNGQNLPFFFVLAYSTVD